MVKKPWPDEANSSGGDEQPLRSIRPAHAEPRPDLQEALAVVWLRKWSILAIALLTLGVALLVSSRQTPIYESQARILVTPIEDVGADSTVLSNPNLATESEVLDSVAVAQIVATNLDISGPPRDLLNALRVDNPTDTEILEVAYRDPDALQAQRMAMGFAQAYLQYREETVTQARVDSAKTIQEEIAALTQDLQTILSKIQGLSATDPQRGSLETEASLLRTDIRDRQVDEIRLRQEVTVGRIIQPAPLPSSPVSPNHVVNGAFGLASGLALGIGLAFLRDRLSERLRSSEEAEVYLEAPMLGAIPPVPAWRRRKEAFLVSSVQWRAPPAEAYRVLRTNVLSAAAAFEVKSIVITSAYGGEGKSATTANLGVVLARAGKRVSVVSADLRRPRLHEFFKREGQPGLIEVLAGRASLADALQDVTLPTHGFDAAAARLRLLPSGRVPEDPSELLTSETMAKVLRDLENVSDMVLIDVPPVLPVTDALLVASLTKNVLLVVGPKGGTRSAMTAARQKLDRVGARILGGVLNGSDPSMSQTYYSY